MGIDLDLFGLIQMRHTKLGNERPIVKNLIIPEILLAIPCYCILEYKDIITYYFQLSGNSGPSLLVGFCRRRLNYQI